MSHFNGLLHGAKVVLGVYSVLPRSRQNHSQYGLLHLQTHYLLSKSEDLTLSWSYNINGTLAYAKLFYIGDSQSKKLIALKPSVGSGDINMDAAFQDRFFLNISDTQALVKILAVQRSDKGTYRYEITNLDLVSISSDVEIIVLCE
ncbi:hypothetical protein OS493_031140 [Desmophyllum pertusum]|uniref:Immunoglobulin V-set domain-containing protein n=1 Tax=Desmophyllum pertusum TaxID=174260 RepID=A0A9W9Y8J3_9CNID|nr:hypothetical protein OS493_031140 [Desmophyllum pertusum]